MKGKLSLETYMGRICACAMLLSGSACTREPESARTREPEPEKTYQDPWANPNEKTGQYVAESFESAELHEGRYSVYDYEFKGKGPAHTLSDVRKYGLDHAGSRGSDVHVKMHVEWPEWRAGLTKDALAKVRKAILWMNFVLVPMPCPHTGPESLGETEDSLRERNKELWAKEGMDRDIEEFGLQPADWATLCCDALSYETGRLPASNNGRISTKALEAGLAEIKANAQACYKCETPEKLNDGWWHYCSQWSFGVDQHIDLPFGPEAKEDAKWYERPVLCVWVEGYDDDGGNGCHCRYCSKVYSLPDGIELGVEDYFAPGKLKKLSAFVTERLYRELLAADEATQRLEYPLDLEEASMLVSKAGVRWTWPAYSILPGCYCTPSVFIKWRELEAFK